MSRYELPCHREDHEAVCGWDAPLETYFCEVWRIRAKSSTSVLWLGGFPREVPHAEDMIAPLAPFAVLDEAMIARLKADRAAGLDRAPTALQRQGLRALSTK